MSPIDIGVFRASEFNRKVRQQLGDQTISDPTIRRWRQQAYLGRKSVYTEDDVNQVVAFAQILYQVRNVQIAQDFLIKHINSTKEPNSEQDTIDAQFETLSREVQ
jgi:hypothetical protein